MVVNGKSADMRSAIAAVEAYGAISQEKLMEKYVAYVGGGRVHL